MKTVLNSIALLLLTGSLQAKKVKFAVDMTGQTINATGVHVTGDFQQAAGLGPDWDPGTAVLTKEGSTNIYSIIVDIPAFKKYEYRFLNGDQTYESEFVPDESRVGYDFVDNRWLFVDSLKNDTSFVGSILFGGNAPAGKILVRYKVDMSLAGTIPSTGAHIGTNYQMTSFDPTRMRLYSFGNGVYEVIHYVTNNTYSFIYFNGNTSGASETVPSTCETNGKRTVTITGDVILPTVCFSSCVACVGVGISENTTSTMSIKIYPNPSHDFVSIKLDTEELVTLSIKDYSGKEVKRGSYATLQTVNVSDLQKGIYLVELSGKTVQAHSKLIVD